MSEPASTHRPEDLARALGDELQGVASRPERGTPGPSIQGPSDLPKLHDLRLLGLAFSGGGIRSATFNLGVLQTLDRLGVLTFVDYLSTVSGGGYIGSWYLACLRQGLTTDVARGAALRHLRRFSQYLAPRTGFFSADTWTIGSIWLRNALLLQTMLVALFAIALLSPRLFQWAFLAARPDITLLVAIVSFGLSVTFISRGLTRVQTWADASAAARGRDPGRAGVDGQGWVQVLVVLPALVGAACLASMLWRVPQTAPGASVRVLYLGGLVALSTGYTARASLPRDRRSGWAWPLVVFTGVLCGALFAGLVLAVGQLFQVWRSWPSGPWLAALTGAPLLLIALSLTVVLQIGLLGRSIDDACREWWGRLGAFLGIYSLGPLLLALTVLAGPPLVEHLATGALWQKWAGGSVGLGGLVTLVSGLVAARSPSTGGGQSSPARELVAHAAPFVFAGGLLITVATGLHWILASAPACAGMAGYWQTLDCSIRGGLPSLVAATVVSAAVLAVFARRIDINEASMNPFYRNRLVRCYQGAARAGTRRPNPFTGFDAEDDFALSWLQPAHGYQGPVPIVNVALNLTGGDDAGLQERRATSFFFTPYRSGSDTTGVIDTTELSRYGDGIRLGACVATSGAAASPNMGYHTSAPVAFLMTFFNIRLGLWIRNPLAGPGKLNARWGFYYLLKELFATAESNDRYIYLSDGGHFENLGVYELIRRRCRFIIACDAEQDGAMLLQGLGGLVRKCRIDFGVEIDIDTSAIRERDDRGFSRAHYAVGRIRYPDARPGEEPGYLVYLKSSMTGDERSDVLQYKGGRPDFPHESTGDQFFSESQFESYRALGEHVAASAFGASLHRRVDLETWLPKPDARG